MAKAILNMERQKRYLTVQEVAANWELHESTVRDLAEARIIPGTRVGIRKWQFLRTTIERLGAGKPNLPFERYNFENTTAVFIYFTTDAPAGLSEELWDDIRNLMEQEKYAKSIKDHDVRHSDPERSQRNRGIINTARSGNRKKFRED